MEKKTVMCSLNKPCVQFSYLSAKSVCVFVCLFVPSQKTHFPVDWRLLVKGVSLILACTNKMYTFSCLDDFLEFLNFTCFLSSKADQPTMFNGRDSRGKV